MDNIRRRVTLGLAASALLPRVAFGQAQIKLNLAHNSAPSSPKGMGATKFAELVAAKSKGRIVVQVAPSEQLGNENTNMSALRTGTLDLGTLGQGAMLSVAPEVAALACPSWSPLFPKRGRCSMDLWAQTWPNGSKPRTLSSSVGSATASGKQPTTNARFTRRMISRG